MNEQPEPAEREALLAEYREVSDNIRHCVVLCWEAFKTYVVIMPVLVVLLALAAGRLPDSVVHALWLGVPVLGAAVSVIACFGVRRVVAYEKLLIGRGVRLERALNIVAGQLTQTSGFFARRRSTHFDSLSYAVFGLFAVGWTALLLGPRP